MSFLRHQFHFFRDVVHETSRDGVSVMAAGLAYYTIFAFAPILIIIIATNGIFVGTDLIRVKLIARITAALGSDGGVFIERLLQNASSLRSNIFAVCVGIVLFFYVSSNVFAHLQDTMNRIWKIPKEVGGGIKAFVQKRALALVALFFLGMFIIFSIFFDSFLRSTRIFVDSVFPFYRVLVTLQTLKFAASFFVYWSLFTIVYVTLPQAKVFVRDARYGAAIAAFAYTLISSLLSSILSKGNITTGYGAAGTFVALLLWVYYAAQIFLLGVEITKVHSIRRRRFEQNSPPHAPL